MNKELWNKLVQGLRENEIMSYFGSDFEVWCDKSGTLYYILTNDKKSDAFYIEETSFNEVANLVLNTSQIRWDEAFGSIQPKEPKEEIERLAAQINDEEKTAYEEKNGKKWFFKPHNYLSAARSLLYSNIKNAPESKLVADNNGIYIQTEEGEKLLDCNREEHEFLYALKKPVDWVVAFLLKRMKQIEKEKIQLFGDLEFVCGLSNYGLVLFTSPYHYAGPDWDEDDAPEIKKFKYEKWEAEVMDVVSGKRFHVRTMESRALIEKGLATAPDEESPNCSRVIYCPFHFPKFINTWAKE